jgi:hypothetical protein
MPYFCIHVTTSGDADSYWVKAETAQQACRLVALNIADAAEAIDAGRFDCQVDDSKKPPAGFIHRRLLGPVLIVKR